jgi:5-methyltetrahydropteroyltriglutamate--homocysteine methyltransferase
VLEKLPGKTIILGVLDLSTHEIETPETRRRTHPPCLAACPAERLIIAPDCGLKYLPRDIAFGKMKAMADGARLVRAESRDLSADASSPRIRRQPAAPG